MFRVLSANVEKTYIVRGNEVFVYLYILNVTFFGSIPKVKYFINIVKFTFILFSR